MLLLNSKPPRMISDIKDPRRSLLEKPYIPIMWASTEQTTNEIVSCILEDSKRVDGPPSYLSVAIPSNPNPDFVDCVAEALASPGCRIKTLEISLFSSCGFDKILAAIENQPTTHLIISGDKPGSAFNTLAAHLCSGKSRVKRLEINLIGDAMPGLVSVFAALEHENATLEQLEFTSIIASEDTIRRLLTAAPRMHSVKNVYIREMLNDCSTLLPLLLDLLRDDANPTVIFMSNRAWTKPLARALEHRQNRGRMHALLAGTQLGKPKPTTPIRRLPTELVRGVGSMLY